MMKYIKSRIDYIKESLYGTYTDDLNERRITVKRKYTDEHPSIEVGKHAPVRQKILGYIAEQGGSVSKEELKEYISGLREEFGRKTTFRWVKRNSRYIQETNGVYKLTKLGKRVLRATNISEQV